MDGRTLFFVLNLRSFQFLGKISYGIYLTHMLIFEVVAHFTLRYLPSLQPTAGHFNLIALQFCVAGSLTIALTYVSRWYFEESFLRMKDGAKHAAANTIRVDRAEIDKFEVVGS